MTLSLSARERVFVKTTGKNVSRVYVQESHENGHHTFSFDIDGRKSSQIVDAGYHTLRWELVDPAKGTNAVIVAREDGYHIDGTFEGKSVHKIVPRKGGKVWIQNVGYTGGHFLKPGDRFEYMNFSLHNLKPYDMCAVYVGKENRNGISVYHFLITPSGAFSKFWKAHYYFDVTTGDLMFYNSVEGLPGTPETFWTPAPEKQ